MVEQITPFEALVQALDIAGSKAELARICECSHTAVLKMVQSAKRLSPQFVLRVEAATGVPRFLLRPDIYPRDMPPLPASAIAEPFPLCGPVLSTRMVDRQGKAQHFLDKGAGR